MSCVKRKSSVELIGESQSNSTHHKSIVTYCLCGKNIATYRCQTWEDKIPNRYLSRIYTYKQYIACDSCITPELRIIFTHHPTGWCDNDEYEFAN